MGDGEAEGEADLWLSRELKLWAGTWDQDLSKADA